MVVLLAAAAAARCGSGSTTILAPTEQRCALTVSPANATTGAGGGTGSLTVTTSRECQWTASTAATWLQLSSNSGQGPGTISYEASANRTPASRSAVVAVGGLQATITQQAAACSFSVSPDVITIGPAGGELTVSLSTDDFCSWSASSEASWVTVSPPTGTGGAEIHIRVDANLGSDRHGVVTVGGTSVAVDQTAAPTQGGSSPATCTVMVAPLSFTNVPSAASTLNVTVTAQTGCAWTASSSQSWISITQGASGSGNGTVRLSVLLNQGTARSGSVTVAGQTVTVSQVSAANPCAYTIAPASYTAPLAGGTVQVGVTTSSGCGWTATGNPAWIGVSPAGGTGNGTVSLTVQANSGVSRNATLTIATQSFTVTQAGTAACSYAINQTSFNNVTGAGASTTVAITTTSGCAWTVSGNPAWITSNPTGRTGSGNTTITVEANTGAARNATFQIAGQSFTVGQLASCTYTVNPLSFTLSSLDQTQTIAVATQTGCPSSAAADVGWIHITSSPPPGGGNVVFNVDKNGGTQIRNGVITVTGQSFTRTVAVAQDGK